MMMIVTGCCRRADINIFKGIVIDNKSEHNLTDHSQAQLEILISFKICIYLYLFPAFQSQVSFSSPKKTVFFSLIFVSN